MQNRIDINGAHCSAILREIGKGLRAHLSDDADLPPSFKAQIDRLRELESQPVSSKFKYRSLELLCRHQAALTCHEKTKAELQNMAREYQRMADFVKDQDNSKV